MTSEYFWLVEDGKKKGPFTITQMKTMWTTGQITGDSLYWQQDFDEPIQVFCMIDLLETAAEPQRPKRGFFAKSAESEKCILPALLLMLFLGVIGAHRFYAGKIGTGMLFIVMLITGWLFYFPLVVLAVWLVIDFCLIVTGSLTDDQGRKIKTWT